MAIGMSYEEFWYEDSNRVYSYKKAFDLKREMRNQEMWVQGMYFYNALGTVLDNALNKHSRAKYLDKPIDIYPKSKTQKEIEQEKEKKRVIEHFTKLKKQWDLQKCKE